MRVLLDECVPAPLAAELVNHEVVTVGSSEWAGLRNGALLDAAEAAGFEAFVTVDKNLQYQQNLSGRQIRVLLRPPIV